MFNINLNNKIEDQFNKIAEELFSKYELVVNNAVFNFCEIEFYFQSDIKHDDPYAHKDKMQLTNGNWYFHGSGIDFTFGDGKNFGGILIRGLNSAGKDNGEFISGPLLVAKEIFKHFGGFEYKSHSLGIRVKRTPRILAKNDFIASTRINLPKREDKEDFKNRKYRFLTFIKPEHPFKEKEKVAQIFKEKGLNVEKINDLFGYKILKKNDHRKSNQYPLPGRCNANGLP